MAKLLAKIERSLGASWSEISDWLRSQNTLDAIESRLIAGDWQGAIVGIESAASKFAAEAHQGYVVAGRTTAEWLDSVPSTSDRLVRFDEVNVGAVNRARANEYELVEGFTAEQRDKTRAALVDGMSRGANPREVARGLRDGLGLTAHQEEHVRNYRRALESGDFANVTGRQLHDDRHNRRLRGLADGDRLPPEYVDKLTEEYRQSYVNHRAEVIARTEALRSANEGAHDAIEQAIERGDIAATDLVVTWHAGPATADARPEHQALDNTSVPWGETFELPGGVRMRHPGDPAGGAENNAQCRCTASQTIA